MKTKQNSSHSCLSTVYDLPNFLKKDLVANLLDKSISSNPVRDMNTLSSCNHEEADTRMFAHLVNCLTEGITKIHIRSGDTDVLVLAVNVCTKHPEIEQLVIHFGSGKNFRVIDVISICSGLGIACSCVLPLFHSFTGCDTVSSFAGRGKKTAWSVWKTFPELTHALQTLTNNPDAYKEEKILAVIQKYVVLLYNRTCSVDSVNDARRKLFASRSGLENIPPTKDSLVQHLKRSIFQGSLNF